MWLAIRVRNRVSIGFVLGLALNPRNLALARQSGHAPALPASAELPGSTWPSLTAATRPDAPSAAG